MGRKVGFAVSVLGVALLVALAPAFACTANGAVLKVTPGKADPGAAVTVIGEQFAATGPAAGSVTIRWNGPSGLTIGTVDVGEDGTFQVPVVIPADAFGGFYQINATQWLPDAEAKKPSVTIEVLGPPAPAPAEPAPAVAEPAPAAPVVAPTAEVQPAPAEPVKPAPARAATRTRPPAAAPTTPVAPAKPAAAVVPAPPVPAVVADVPPPVVAPGTVTADLWSGFGTVRSPAWVASGEAGRTPAGSDDASRLWMVPMIAGLALIGAGVFGLARRPRAVAAEAEPTSTTDD